MRGRIVEIASSFREVTQAAEVCVANREDVAINGSQYFDPTDSVAAPIA
jgi:hypothetical protein